jgi:hypothetical protein
MQVPGLGLRRQNAPVMGCGAAAAAAAAMACEYVESIPGTPSGWHCDE